MLVAFQAAVNVYSLANLPPLLARFGNRGYRAAQLEGGITGGRLYLAAYAQRFGATGLTFFDDEVRPSSSRRTPRGRASCSSWPSGIRTDALGLAS